MEPKAPEYLEAVVQKKPHLDDPKEVAIAGKIKDQVFRLEWAKESIAKIRSLQIDYMRKIIAKSEDAAFVRGQTQEVLKEIAGLLKAQVAEGSEFLADIPKGSSVLVMTNHLGLYKLAGIDPKKELEIDIPGYDFMYPSPMYFAGLSPVAEAIGDELSYVSDDFPGIFGEIHRASGFIHVPPPNPDKTSRVGVLLEQTDELFKMHPNTALVNFPEGGTSGKYSGLGPYDLDPFKSGGYIIASKLGIRIIPVAQYFHPEKGLQLKVFPSYIPEIRDQDSYEKYLVQDKNNMQEWLDSEQHGNHF